VLVGFPAVTAFFPTFPPKPELATATRANEP
jgi:hypothetical protein